MLAHPPSKSLGDAEVDAHLTVTTFEALGIDEERDIDTTSFDYVDLQRKLRSLTIGIGYESIMVGLLSSSNRSTLLVANRPSVSVLSTHIDGWEAVACHAHSG